MQRKNNDLQEKIIFLSRAIQLDICEFHNESHILYSLIEEDFVNKNE